MNTKSATPPQAEAQDVAPRWPLTEELVLSGAKALGKTMADTDNWADDFSASQKAMLTGWSRGVLEAIAASAHASGWRPMSSAPVGDVTACIDIWSGEEACRVTGCFWDADLGAWAREVLTDLGDYRAVRVPDPVAWMPAPVKPEGL